MHQVFLEEVRTHIYRNKIKHILRKFVHFLCCVVVFCTTYALILPAITLEQAAYCGLEEHTHSEECYQYIEHQELVCNKESLQLHSHSASCYDSDANLICGLADYVVHTHAETCFHNGQLVCTLPERSAHVHNETCYIPGETEPEVLHVHIDDCYTQQNGDLICNIEAYEGHAHDNLCYVIGNTLTCTLVENHVHQESCYTYPLICTLSTDPHIHSADCYGIGEQLCTTEEGHVHGSDCSITSLNCENTEEGHEHNDSCYHTEVICTIPENHFHDSSCYSSVILCGKTEGEFHEHGADCYSAEPHLTCTLTENHFHDDNCYAKELICTVPEDPGHSHTDDCYQQERVLTCGMEEGQPEPTEPAEPILNCTEPVAQEHVHGESCFVIVGTEPALICEITEDDHIHTEDCYGCATEEHTHTLACYSDPEADVESAAVWESTFAHVALTGDPATDVVAIARTQIGYTESTRNYEVWEDNSVHGYTRYGAWYGVPYGDWCGMFASFCLRYAGVDSIPINYGVRPWIDDLTSRGLYYSTHEIVPTPGCLIFFDWEQDGLSDHVGIVEEVVGTDVVTIEGNSGNRVARNSYSLHDGRIAGYGLLTKPEAPKEEDSVYIDPNDTTAWAVLLDPDGQIMQSELQDELQAPYGLRQTSAVFMSSARAGDPLQLNPYINNVTMYDKAGNIIPSGSVVTEGDEIQFKIEYTIEGQKLGVMNGENITVYSDTLTYKLPEILEVVRSTNGNIVNAQGQTVGTYVIDSESETITMTFDEDYVKQNATGNAIHGFISVFSTVTKITDKDSEKQDYEFTDNITLGIVVQEGKDAVGDLTIEKKTVNVVGEEIEYELIVNSTEGTKGPITITDTMSTGLTFQEGISVQKGDGTSVEANFVAAEGNGSFTLELPEMAAEESYTVRYKCKADIDLLGAEMTARNTATVIGKDSQDVELKDETTTEYQFEVLKKTGKANDDGTITWTITINQAKADISGWKLEDFIGYGNNSVPYTGTVTIEDSNETVVGDNITLPYTFPDGSTDTYTVTYTTSHDLADGDTIYNKAVLKHNDTEVNDFAGVGIIGNPFTKTGEIGQAIQDEDGNYLLPITWTVTIDTTSAAIPGGAYFLDILEGMVNSHAEDMYMTYGQLMSALASFEAETKRITGEEAEDFSAWIYVPGNETGEAYNIIHLRDNKDNCQSAKFDRFAITLGEKGIPKGNVLTFSYEAYGVFPNDFVSTETFVNRFSLQGQYEVEVPVDYVTGSVTAKKFALKAFDPYADNIPEWKWIYIDWNSVEGISWINYENLHDSYLAWGIELDVPPGYSSIDDIVIYEDLPAGVSVKRVELPFQDGVPTPEFLQLSDMAPGNTYSWDFTLYPADQYGQYQPQGGESVSIEVHVTEAGDLKITIPGKVLKVMGEYAALKGMVELYGHLYIYTQINDDFDWPPEQEGSLVYVNNFENKFTITDEHGRVVDIGKQTQVITKDESEGSIRKEATTDENNIITYSVLLNTYGKDLIANADTLNIHDELTYQSTAENPLSLTFVPGSVKLYEVDMKSDGSYTKGKELTVNYHIGKSSTEQYGITTWVHTIDLTAPDDKALLLEYSYKASGTANTRYNVSNTCTIQGVGQGGINGEHAFEIEVKQAAAQADTEGIMIFKVDANSDGIFLKDAKFHIYIWNEEKGKYLIVHHPDDGGSDFVTDANGMILLDGSTVRKDQFAYNTAYYIEEVEQPDGYYLDSTKYYFQIVHPDTIHNPSCLPDNFDGEALTRGAIIYRQNTSNLTEITVEKYWLDYFGETMTVTGDQISSITLELWQMVEGDPDSAILYDHSDNPYTMRPDEDGKWSLTIKGLPKTDPNDREKNYLYYVKEVAVDGYVLDAEQSDNDGINSGTIRLVNRQQEAYELPETGGTGTIPYTMAGWMLILLGMAYLMYRSKARGREEF